jgi:hypothetical protein
MPDKKTTYPVFDSKKIKELQDLSKKLGDTTKGIGGGKSKW